MRKVAFLAVIALFGMVASGFGYNTATSLLNSPYKMQNETYAAGETVECSLLIGGGTAALFGTDQIFGTAPTEFIVSELFAPFRVFRMDEDCVALSTWSTAIATSTMTGVTVDEPTGGIVYWVCDPFGAGALVDYNMFTGVAGPNPNRAFPPGFPGVWGPAAMDNNRAGRLVETECIAADQFVQIDVATGAFGPSFANPDNAGSGAYGNGASEAADLGVCGGKTLVVTSGTIGEGQVARGSQMDETGMGCYESWDLYTPLLPFGEWFVNGAEEYISANDGGKKYMVAGNVLGTMFDISKPIGIADCQGQDSPASDVVYVNASKGGFDFTVEVDNTAPLGFAIQQPPAGSAGKYAVHLNSGVPSGATLTTLPAKLGVICFPLLIPPFGTGAPVCVWNNIGKTAKIGASNYFGTPIANPAKAPTYFVSDATGDSANFALGTQWTIQGITLNNASATKGASVTNGIIIDVTAGV